MKKKICVVTGNRADYYLLKPLLKRLQATNKIILSLIVTGAHLCANYGYTYRDIEQDDIAINKKIEILLNSDSFIGTSKSMSLAIISFSEYFSEENIDMVVLLGDRFEIFSAAISANLAKIPIAHIYGGESTIGSSDEGFRHSITKLSYIHFTATEIYRNRVIQLGEQPNRVFNVGSLGIENIKTLNLLSKKELQSKLNFDLNSPYALITFHPETLEGDSYVEHLKILLEALDKINELNLIFTKANGDSGSNYINIKLEQYCNKNKSRWKLFDSLGDINYLSAMKYSSVVIGNSSSGIIEAPSFNIPTVNIGSRQNGRIKSKSIINCDFDKIEIQISIKTALSSKLSNVYNPYEKNDTSENILRILIDTINNPINLKKTFYDI